MYQSGDTAKPRLLLVAPAGVVAIDINGNKIHTRLYIPCEGKLFPLLNTHMGELTNKHPTLRSGAHFSLLMKYQWISSKLFYRIHKCLN